MLCLMERIGYRFSDEGLLRLALTHPSSAQPGGESNQRLEFLGDAVLQLCASHSLYLRHPQMHEGELSRLRAALVQESSLHRVALAWQLGGLLRLGPGEESSGGRDKPSILADAVEAVLGAVYLDGRSRGGPANRQRPHSLPTPAQPSPGLQDRTAGAHPEKRRSGPELRDHRRGRPSPPAPLHRQGQPVGPSRRAGTGSQQKGRRAGRRQGRPIQTKRSRGTVSCD